MTPEEWYRKNFGGGNMGLDIGGMKLTPENTASVGNVSFGPQGGANAGVTGTTQEVFGDAQIPTTPMQQSDAGVLGGGGSFDFGKLATALGSMNSGPEPMQAVDTRPANAGQQIQPIQIYGGQPAGMSGAMQAITGGQRMGMAGAMDQEELRRLRGY